MAEESKQDGRYLYAFVSGNGGKRFPGIGIEKEDVYLMSENGKSAVVSNITNQHLRPERRNLKAHQNVLKALMAECTPLPTSFGIIADGEEEIHRILTRNHESLLDQLSMVEGKMEMGLRVVWDVPNIFEYFVATHAELRSLRDRCFGRHGQPSHEDKIELGQMFNALLTGDREAYARHVEDVLGNYCFEIKTSKPRNEREVMNLACLVGRDAEARFEEGILKVANNFDNNYSFDFNGPWAPHNFVNVDLVL